MPKQLDTIVIIDYWGGKKTYLSLRKKVWNILNYIFIINRWRTFFVKFWASSNYSKQQETNPRRAIILRRIQKQYLNGHVNTLTSQSALKESQINQGTNISSYPDSTRPRVLNLLFTIQGRYDKAARTSQLVRKLFIIPKYLLIFYNLSCTSL